MVRYTPRGAAGCLWGASSLCGRYYVSYVPGDIFVAVDAIDEWATYIPPYTVKRPPFRS